MKANLTTHASAESDGEVILNFKFMASVSLLRLHNTRRVAVSAAFVSYSWEILSSRVWRYNFIDTESTVPSMAFYLNYLDFVTFSTNLTLIITV